MPKILLIEDNEQNRDALSADYSVMGMMSSWLSTGYRAWPWPTPNCLT